MKKICQVCKVEIPEDYQNLLCDSCYKKQEAENAQRKADEEADRAKLALDPKEPIKATPEGKQSDKKLSGITTKDVFQAVEDDFNKVRILPKNGITDPNYKENPEMEDKPQWEANIVQFAKSNILLWKPTRWMYEYVRESMLVKIQEHPQYPKFIWKPKVVDVGCGMGVGSNVLSQEADFVWGIDKNEASVSFAKQAFSRVKNGIYYSSQVTYDHMDILKDTREFLKFDVVVAIEIIEHIYDYKLFLETLIKKFDKRKEGYEATEYFISTPNRNNRNILKDHPQNKYHCREWTSSEYLAILKEYFKEVELFNSKGIPIPKDEYETTTHTPLLAKCSLPKL
ncbi:hypothetical protein LCGC14_1222630 [marine sediment metagenome]|uniref:Methyltransferase domain-containing protein n=1 Tax=marine sediment metagenome TaxID=412755 RepID=A0A0F9LY09_9ZZZZ|nr:methyltransferase domain-containing protein [bacterium]